MRSPICVAVAYALFVLSAQAYGATQRDTDGCQGETPDRTIVRCTQFINDPDESQRLRAIAYYQRGLAWYMKGEGNRARADHAEAVRLDPKLPEYFFNRGMASQIKRDFDRAISEFTATIRLDPKHARAYTHRGRAWYAKGDAARAIYDWTEAIRLDPAYVPAYENRASAWHAQNDLDRAIADYTEAIRLNPSLFRVYMDRGRALQAKGDNDRAIADYTEALRLEPKYSYLYYSRGLALDAKGDRDGAIADYTAAIRLDPNNPDTYRKRGEAYFYKGDFAAAAADLQHVTASTTDVYPMLWRFIARGRMDEDGSAELDASAARLKTRGWPDPVIDLYLGRRTVSELRAAARLEEMRTTANAPAETCQAEFYAGQWHLLRGNKNDAKAALQVAAETCPKDYFEYNDAVIELKRLNP